MKRCFFPAIFFLAVGFLSVLSGCAPQSSYPSSRLREALLDICKKEYDIQDLDVKIAGKTVGVYLPLKKLFAADFKEAAVTGKVRNLETLFEPSPEALEKVEDVLFSISRVLLSTDRQFDFYVVEATDTEKTGMQLVLTGNVNDIKRVRVWDISRNEYRKRVIHELRLNRAVIWHKPVRQFFKDLETLPVTVITQKYFAGVLTPSAAQHLFFNGIFTGEAGGSKPEWIIEDIRSAPVQKNQVLVYAKVTPKINGKLILPEGKTLQYLFMLAQEKEDTVRVLRIVPFQYQDEGGKFQQIEYPKELNIDQNLEKWETEFSLTEKKLGSFLAEQLTRRVQAIVTSDERVMNTFHDVKLSFDYQEIPVPSHFSLNLEASLKDLNHYDRKSLVFHEDMIYLLSLASREFVELVRSYQFGDYDYLSLNVAQEPNQWFLGRDNLELFRRKKVDLQSLLSLPKA